MTQRTWAVLAVAMAPTACGPDESAADADDDGFTPNEGDCNDEDSATHPGAEESCNGVDNDCDALVDNRDIDGDGFIDSACGGEDCADENPGLSPTATDMVGDALDQNCDGADGLDADGDGHASEATGGDDCDDSDAASFPAAPEVWYDGVDQGCVGDAWAGDDDQDGDGVAWDGSGGLDCDDTNAAINPWVADPPDGIDNNCTDVVDGQRIIIEWPDSGQGHEVVFRVTDLPSSEVWLSIYTPVRVEDGIHGSPNTHCLYGWDIDPAQAWIECGGDVGSQADDLTYLFVIDVGTGECFVWGHAPETLDPDGVCRRDDPTEW